MTWGVRQGDCVALMRELAPESVDALVTDPPYGLGFMGRKWDALPPGVEWAAECLRVLKPGGHLLAFGGTRTYHRLACAIEDAGFEIRDCLAWLYGSGFPKSHNLHGEYEGWGTALKPAHEPIVMARKSLAGTVAQNASEHGTGALNVDGCRIGLGRWPVNVALDDDAARMLDAQTGDLPAGVAHRGNGGGNTFGGDRAKPALDDLGYGDQGGASRFFYVAKASRAERNAGLDDFRERPLGGQLGQANGKRMGRSTAEGAGVRESVGRNHHPTVKPIELMRWLARLVTPPGGLVIDPFAGSGTTGCACALEGFDFLGMEREAEYVELANARIAHWASRPSQLGLEAA